MRRILAAIVSPLVRRKGLSDLLPAVEEAEAQVLNENRAHFNRVMTAATSAKVAPHLQPMLDDAVRMAKHQIAILDAYPINLNAINNGK